MRSNVIMLWQYTPGLIKIHYKVRGLSPFQVQYFWPWQKPPVLKSSFLLALLLWIIQIFIWSGSYLHMSSGHSAGPVKPHFQGCKKFLELPEVRKFLRMSQIFQCPFTSSTSKIRSMPNHSFVLLKGVHIGPYMDVVRTSLSTGSC